MKLQIIIASTRPGRIGPAIGDWVVQQAKAHGGFDVEVTDLAELNLPFLDEAAHPMLGQYEHEHTLHWSATVAGSDAFVLVVPEYNHSFTAPIKNALDFLNKEWAYKPVAFVSYGGISGGTRAVTMLRQVVATLRMVPVVDGVDRPDGQDDDRRAGISPERHHRRLRRPDVRRTHPAVRAAGHGARDALTPALVSDPEVPPR